MEQLRESVDLIFHKFPAASALRSLDEGAPEKFACQWVDRAWFVGAFPDDELCYTEDQRKNIYSLLMDKWMLRDESWTLICGAPQPSVFNVLLHFCQPILTERNNVPLCHYESLLRWHSMSSLIDEDLFTTAFLAARDTRLARRRCQFDWPTNLDTDSTKLEQLFHLPVADLHHHFYGSSDSYLVNWLSFMRTPLRRTEALRDLYRNYLSPIETLSEQHRQASIEADLFKAAVIRGYLLHWLQGDPITENHSIKLRLSNVLHDYHVSDTVLENTDLIGDWDMHLSNPMEREREFMYRMLLEIYSGRASAYYANLFYIYLLSKCRFKHEMVQLNRREGFTNFQHFDHRKGIFAHEDEWRFLGQAALHDFFRDHKNRHLETRITPKDSIEKYEETISEIESAMRPDSGTLRFVVHFIKEADKNEESENLCRHYNLRKKVQSRTMVLAHWRELHGETGKIVGIDAASSEIACRPEVFSQSFRFLKSQLPPDDIPSKAWTEKLPVDFGYTYHVGEDFLDVADGLRAIDEVFLFLNFRQGDRIGHALALGIDIDKYYERRHHCIAIPKQVLLDNVVWLLERGQGCQSYYAARMELIRLFEKYRNEIYNFEEQDDEVQSYSPLDFYHSWQLRGDEPACYDQKGSTVLPHSNIHWGLCDLNDNPEAVASRHNQHARKLYFQYHFNPEVKIRGKRCDLFEASPHYIALVKEVQEMMLGEVEQRQLSIETNPTSNLRIGNIGQYDLHPIFRFYNYGLTLPDGIRPHAIPVTINTDDRGIFETSIEREFALLAAAMEKDYRKGLHNNPPQQIYNWLNDIRQKAFEQRFCQRDNWGN